MAGRRAQQVARERAEKRYADQRAELAEIERLRSEWESTMKTRRQAAAYLGLKPSTLADMWSRNVGPMAIKMSPSRQGRIFYPVEELDEWRRNPLAYHKPARAEEVGPFEPPRRGNRDRSRPS